MSIFFHLAHKWEVEIFGSESRVAGPHSGRPAPRGLGPGLSPPLSSHGQPSSPTPCHMGGGPLQGLTSTRHTCHNPASKCQSRSAGPRVRASTGNSGHSSAGTGPRQGRLQYLLAPRFPPSLGDPGDLPPSVPTHPHLVGWMSLVRRLRSLGKTPRKLSRCVSRCAHRRQSMFSSATGQTCPSKGSYVRTGTHGAPVTEIQRRAS